MNNSKNSIRFQDLKPGTLLLVTRKGGFHFRTKLRFPDWIIAEHKQHLLFLKQETRSGPYMFYSFVLNNSLVYSLLEPNNYISELFKIVQEPY